MKLENISEKEKREKIVNALDKNMFVEAGAGAGKTSLIVSRILNQLMSGIKPREIVAITFTNAATRELRGRILKEASRMANEKGASLPPEKLDNLKAALTEIDQMQISTIHSFCFRILSEKMFDAALPYGFSPSEEGDMEEIRNRAFRLWAETLRREDWEKLLPAGKYRRGVIDRIINLAVRLDSIPDDYEIKVAVPDLGEEDARAQLSPIVEKVSADAVALINRAYGTSYSTISELGDSELNAYGKRLRDDISDNDVISVCKTLLSQPTTVSFILNRKGISKDVMTARGITSRDDQSAFKARVAEDDDAIKSYLASCANDLDRILAGYSNTLYRPFIEYAQNALGYMRERIAKGVISNDKLLEKTRELIRSSDDVRRFFGNKFRIIYVDEFQDTDHTQEGFIRLLASDPADPEKLRDGALFVVGDPKQSIYRFRGAEPEMYFTAKDRMLALDNTYVVELSDNYRSNERIIDWVNAKFASKNITIGQSYILMNTGHPLPSTGLPEKLFAGVFRYESPETALSSDSISSDCQAVCRLIRSLMNNGYQIADRDGEDRVFYREIRYSDFLILCMNTPGMQEYADCFHRYGIPVIMDSKSDVSADHDLLTFIRLYAYLADPWDSASWIGALEALDMSGTADRAENEKILDEIAKDTETLSAYGCIRYLTEHPELYVYKDKEIRDYEIRDLQKKILQMTESIEAGTFGNRADLLNAMREYCGRKVEHELLLKRDIDAVRFMNLHKAKGLEGNIVIWTNRRENRVFKEGEYRCGMSFYPCITRSTKYGPIAEWVACRGDSALKDRAMEEEASESIRLEYVAATRAKQALVFMDRYNKNCGNMFTDGYDLSALDSVEDIVSEYGGEEDPAAPAALPLKTREEVRKEAESLSELKRPVYSSESPSSYEDESAGRAELPEGTPKDPSRPVGNIFGTVMHRAFELVIERRDADPKILGIKPEELVAFCMRQALNESAEDIWEDEMPLYESFLEEAVMAFGRWFWQSDLKKNAVELYTELPFSYLIESDDPEKPPVWMHGEADLVAKMKDGSYYILDYKSDTDEAYPDEAAFTERLRGKYSPQIEAYRKAVGRVFGTDPGSIRAALISFSRKALKDGETLRLRVTDL